MSDSIQNVNMNEQNTNKSKIMTACKICNKNYPVSAGAKYKVIFRSCCIIFTFGKCFIYFIPILYNYIISIYTYIVYLYYIS